MVLQSNHFCEPSIKTIIFGLAVWTRSGVEVQFTKINSLGKKLHEFLEKKKSWLYFWNIYFEVSIRLSCFVILMF